MNARACAIAYCGQAHKGLGLCNKHLLRLRRTGTTDEWQQSLADRFWSKVDRREPDDCWLWTAALNGAGYGVMRPEGQRSGPTVKAHRVSLMLAGVDVEGLVVRHTCDTPPCVNPAHLSVGTPADNAADMVARDRQARGSRSGASKLTEQQVADIRARAAAGELHRVLAAAYGVSRPTISRVVNRKGWLHVSTIPTP
ncbi:helix-turn-helix domain-containing protein [Streptomyces pristinaespiralis]|uniref:helix-turn-helix domain-containing protein n=1 Tax=Streptomyces pristinaespiralis TaxID=38300 RepID=UPI0037B4D8D3